MLSGRMRYCAVLCCGFAHEAVCGSKVFSAQSHISCNLSVSASSHVLGRLLARASLAILPALPCPTLPRTSPPGDRLRASPYARKLAAEQGLSLAGLPGSGPGGRVVAADLAGASPAAGTAPSAAAAAAPAAPAPAGAYVDIPHTQIRRVTAQRLLESKQTIPHYYLSVEVQVRRVAARCNVKQIIVHCRRQWVCRRTFTCTALCCS
jgi:pyruvate/2-oxoglutarate dehydrogenase complex dihydrolipoamide acyltransferase (E2) component